MKFINDFAAVLGCAKISQKGKMNTLTFTVTIKKDHDEFDTSDIIGLGEALACICITETAAAKKITVSPRGYPERIVILGSEEVSLYGADPASCWEEKPE